MVSDDPFFYSWAPNHKRDADRFFVGIIFLCPPVLSHSHAVVRGEYDIGVAQFSLLLKQVHDGTDRLVDRLEASRPVSLEVRQPTDVFATQGRKGLYPRRFIANVRFVEARRSWQLQIAVHIGVAGRGLSRTVWGLETYP